MQLSISLWRCSSQCWVWGVSFSSRILPVLDVHQLSCPAAMHCTLCGRRICAVEILAHPVRVCLEQRATGLAIDLLICRARQ